MKPSDDSCGLSTKGKDETKMKLSQTNYWNPKVTPNNPCNVREVLNPEMAIRAKNSPTYCDDCGEVDKSGFMQKPIQK